MPNPVKILHIVGKMDQGGIECLLMNLYRDIDKNKVQFDFLVHSKDTGFFDDEIEALGGKIFNVISPFSIKGLFLYRKQLSKIFQSHKEYNIVHSHMNTFSGIILKQAQNCNVKYRIAHSHTTIAASKLKTPLWKLSRLFGQKSITHRFTCSKDAAFWSFGKYADQAKLFKNAIDTDKYRFRPEYRQRYRDKLNLNNKFIIGHVGRFNEIKNHSFLIDVFSKYSLNNNHAMLLLIGDGPLMSEIQTKVKNMGLEKSVLFLGNRNDVDKLLNVMDVFVFPSINEGLGIVAVEAQTSGLPCIVSSALPTEVQLSNQLEFVHLENGADNWANHINKLQLNNLRKEAHHVVIEKGYDIKSNAKRLTQFYLNCYQTKVNG